MTAAVLFRRLRGVGITAPGSAIAELSSLTVLSPDAGFLGLARLVVAAAMVPVSRHQVRATEDARV